MDRVRTTETQPSRVASQSTEGTPIADAHERRGPLPVRDGRAGSVAVGQSPLADDYRLDLRLQGPEETVFFAP
jgi:hypothetical protein